MKDKWLAILYALLAAAFYAINVPVSKHLLQNVAPTFMAAFLYLGAGVGVGIMYIFHWKKEKKEERLEKADFPYSVGMILLDIVAPIFLMFGIQFGTASNASLLGNFEIVATTLIALCIFKEVVTKKLWMAILFTTIASILLSFEGEGSFSFSIGSLLVILATCCWGMENNCTRKIADKSTYQIVVCKGICSGLGAFIIALCLGESIPDMKHIVGVMLLGFVAYGLSIFLYIRAQRTLGAAKTSAYYAVAPFVGAILSFFMLKENLTSRFIVAFLFMMIGTACVIWDTIVKHHMHQHEHTITHTHDGVTHTHVISHTHVHDHYIEEQKHGHHHSRQELEKEIGHHE